MRAQQPAPHVHAPAHETPPSTPNITTRTSANPRLTHDYGQQITHGSTLDNSSQNNSSQANEATNAQASLKVTQTAQTTTSSKHIAVSVATDERTNHCMQIYTAVRKSNMPNYKQARIPLSHELNMTKWRELLRNYTRDPQLCDFLEFGWPANYCAERPPLSATENHGSAAAHPEDVADYIKTELRHGALLGPFPADRPPFIPWFQVNALMTRPKKGSDKRRIIVDLSWPTDVSVNSGIPRDVYQGEPYKLKLPTADKIADKICKLGQGCYMYSRDIARCYRQLRSDPLDWPLLGMAHENSCYIDTAIPFGLRWGAMAAQRANQGICYIMQEEQFNTDCYIDDYIGVEQDKATATAAFQKLHSVLSEVGFEEAENKAIHPTTAITWIGIHFDTTAMEISIPLDKLAEILTLVKEWAARATATRTQLKSLLGKLHHVGQCCKPARLFVSRMLYTLRAAPARGKIALDSDFQKDINWFLIFLEAYNGIHLLKQPATIEVEVDACLTGCGGCCGRKFYCAIFPPSITDLKWPIAQLEMLNVLLAVKLWAQEWEHKAVTIYSDNAATVATLQAGRARDTTLLACAREVWLLTALRDCTIYVQHRPGAQMVHADALSREHTSNQHRQHVKRLTEQGYEQVTVHAHMFEIMKEI